MVAAEEEVDDFQAEAEALAEAEAAEAGSRKPLESKISLIP